jgi:hypothetical protein
MLVSIADQHGQNWSIPFLGLGNYSDQHGRTNEIAMNHAISIPLQRPLLERWTYHIAEFIVCAWQKRRARRDLHRRIDAMADLSVAVLRDIGGPDELLNQAVARRDANVQRTGEMRMLAGFRGVDSRVW